VAKRYSKGPTSAVGKNTRTGRGVGDGGAGEASAAAGAVTMDGGMFSRGMSSNDTWSMRSPVS